ncbi:hypothetical protein P7F88_03390 [Vibrio hannami]|uniref:hypothetical protein n=1 Tax=Vibrio hannami TaxID=2717094 RepID=UPI00240EF6B6|nr:hypothetical protein [Vibrio hannami]MDG3085194.1 hypothetical protein [Vibrio hannami]
MSNETQEQLKAYRLILLAIDDVVRAGAQPRYDGDDSSSNPASFKKLVMQYAGDKVSEEAIDQALKIPLQDIAKALMNVSKTGSVQDVR